MRREILVFALAIVGMATSVATPRLDAQPINQMRCLCDAQRLSWDFGYPGFGGWASGYRDFTWWPYNSWNWSWYLRPFDPPFWWDYPYLSTMYYSRAYLCYWGMPYVPVQTSRMGVASVGNQAPQQPTITHATIEVYLPSVAELWIDGRKTTETGSQRSFSTVALTEGQTLTVEVRASWMANGSQVNETRTVRLQAGNQRIMNFMVGTAATNK